MQNNNNCFNGFLMDFVTFDPSEVIRDAYCVSNFHENNAFIPHVKKKLYNLTHKLLCKPFYLAPQHSIDHKYTLRDYYL